jgi:hypothetical protein
MEWKVDAASRRVSEAVSYTRRDAASTMALYFQNSPSWARAHPVTHENVKLAIGRQWPSDGRRSAVLTSFFIILTSVC